MHRPLGLQKCKTLKVAVLRKTKKPNFVRNSVLLDCTTGQKTIRSLIKKKFLSYVLSQFDFPIQPSMILGRISFSTSK